MSFLSFLSSHRMHFGSHHRAWIDPLPVQLDLIMREKSARGPDSVTLDANGFDPAAASASVTLGGIAGDAHRIGFSDEPGP